MQQPQQPKHGLQHAQQPGRSSTVIDDLLAARGDIALSCLPIATDFKAVNIRKLHLLRMAGGGGVKCRVTTGGHKCMHCRGTQPEKRDVDLAVFQSNAQFGLQNGLHLM